MITTHPISVGALKKIVHAASMSRYRLTGEQFIRLVERDLPVPEGSDDLVRIVRIILT